MVKAVVQFLQISVLLHFWMSLFYGAFSLRSGRKRVYIGLFSFITTGGLYIPAGLGVTFLVFK
jgi:hypothetical protein